MTIRRDELQRVIADTTEMTCETLAFMFPMPPPEDGPDPGEQRQEELLRVRVEFEGPFAGTLAVTLPGSMLPELAANMLGLEAEATTAEQHADAARELCNVICGNLLPAIAGAEPVFSVSPPHLCEGRPAPDSELSVSVWTWLDAGWVETEFAVAGGLDGLSEVEAGAEPSGTVRSVA